MVNEGLKLSEAVNAVHCADAADAVQHVCQIIFIFIQLHFIFMHSQVTILLTGLLYFGQLSLLCPAGWEMSTGQRAVEFWGWEVKAVMALSTCG